MGGFLVVGGSGYPVRLLPSLLFWGLQFFGGLNEDRSKAYPIPGYVTLGLLAGALKEEVWSGRVADEKRNVKGRWQT